MFRQKRADTLVGTIERTYNINLNARADALLGNLLKDRGFDSLSQLLRAYRGELIEPAARRRIFLSFHYEDKYQVNGFRLMAHNPNLALDFHDGSVREAVNSERSAYVRQVIGEKIARCSVLVVLIGDGTAWRDWVDWEIKKALEFKKGVCGIRLKGSRGRAPDILQQIGAVTSKWDLQSMISTIELAAARRS